MNNNNSTSIKDSRSDRILNTIIYVIFILFTVIILYPLIFVLSSSFSSGAAVSGGRVLLFPVDFSTIGYELVFQHKAIMRGFRNSVFYTAVGTSINIVLTVMVAYPLSRKNFQGRKLFTTFFMIPMWFSGGLVPTYLLLSDLKLTNTIWAILLSGALSIYNMILVRTYFMNSIPTELFEAARIDGITDIGYLLKVVLPLSKSILGVITLYYAVSHWNSYFSALMYVRKAELQPLQLVLRSVLDSAEINAAEISDQAALAKMIGAVDVIKYAVVVVTTVPILIVYPFVAKYFRKGVMIGSVKG